LHASHCYDPLDSEGAQQTSRRGLPATGHGKLMHEQSWLGGCGGLLGGCGGLLGGCGGWLGGCGGLLGGCGGWLGGCDVSLGGLPGGLRHFTV